MCSIAVFQMLSGLSSGWMDGVPTTLLDEHPQVGPGCTRFKDTFSLTQQPSVAGARIREAAQSAACECEQKTVRGIHLQGIAQMILLRL